MANTTNLACIVLKHFDLYLSILLGFEILASCLGILEQSFESAHGCQVVLLLLEHKMVKFFGRRQDSRMSSLPCLVFRFTRHANTPHVTKRRRDQLIVFGVGQLNHRHTGTGIVVKKLAGGFIDHGNPERSFQWRYNGLSMTMGMPTTLERSRSFAPSHLLYADSLHLHHCQVLLLFQTFPYVDQNVLSVSNEQTVIRLFSFQWQHGSVG